MRGIIKSIKLIEENNEFGFLVEVLDGDNVKKFGGLMEQRDLRKVFFGLLSVLNNYDIASLANIKGKRLSCLVEKPDTLYQRIAAIGNKNIFLVNDKNEGWTTKRIGFKERRLLKSINSLQTGKVINIQSMSGTICMTFDLPSGYQACAGPSLFVGLGYPLVSRELSEDEERFVAQYSSNYIASFIKTISPSKYLYRDKGENKYEVLYEVDESGDVVSIGNTVFVEDRDVPVFINKKDSSYSLEDKPIKKSVKRLNKK